MENKVTNLILEHFNINKELKSKCKVNLNADGIHEFFLTFFLAKKLKMKPEDVYKEVEKKLNSKFGQDYDITFNRFLMMKPKLHKTIEVILKPFSDLIVKKKKKNIIIDFSSPNIAKDLHVGHLRSTIIGDVIAKLFEFQGHNVMRINHLGDFGTPFGKIVTLLMEEKDNQELSVNTLQDYYKRSKKMFDEDSEFKKRAYENTVKLQTGDPKVTKYWKECVNVSRDAYLDIYEKLNISIEEMAESFYSDKIPDMINELEEKGLVKEAEEEGDKRLIFYVDGFEIPLIVKKSDGGYTYDTTDLCALKYRLQTLKADEIYYVVDTGQSLHFKTLFAAGKIAGWITDQKVIHINFGVIKNKNGFRMKSRDGDTFPLKELLSMGINECQVALNEMTKRPKMTKQEEEYIAETVAYSAIKYYDLKHRRTSNYKFNLSEILDFKGDSGVYLLYSFVRANNIVKKASFVEDVEIKDLSPEGIKLLAHLYQFSSIISQATDNLAPNIICDYLYTLSSYFHSFVTSCRVLEFEEDKKTIKKVNKSNLALCRVTVKYLQFIFDLLGMKSVEKM